MGADTIESEKPEGITLTYVDPFPPFAFSRSGKSEGFVIEVLDAALNIHVGARLARELFPGEFKIPKKIFLETPLAVAAPKGTRGDLLERINKGLKIIEEKGTRRRILNTWFRSAE